MLKGFKITVFLQFNNLEDGSEDFMFVYKTI